MMIDRELYPFESRWFQRGDLRMHYLDEGQGDPWLMVHGNPTWSFYYRELVKALCGRFRCIVPDHIGMGLSDKPDDTRYRYTLDSRIDDLDALMQSLGSLERVTLVVHDWGGAIGLAWALRHRERIARIVVLNTGAFPMPTDKRLPFTLKLGRNTRLGALMIRGFNAFAGGAVHMAVVKPMPPAVRRAYVAPYDSFANRIATLRFVQDIPLTDADPAMGTIRRLEQGLSGFAGVPKLMCWGLRDFVFDRHFLDTFRRHWPDAEFEAWDDAGHYVLEDARERVLARIERFIAEHPL